MRLTGFSSRRPRHETEQGALLDWVARAHAQAEATRQALTAGEQQAFAEHVRKVLGRVGCNAPQIRRRGHVLRDVGVPFRDADIYTLETDPHGKGTEARSRFYAEAVAAYFADAYAADESPPSELIHVTCTGYVSPSGAQALVAERGWPTRVTHAYHMGCYAAFPALRMALGSLATGSERVDIVHTELCSLHFDPGVHTVEQLVVQSLFADGFIRYAVAPGHGPGLRVLAVDEQLVPGSAGAMGWMAADHGMHMTLSAKVPELIAGSVRGFVLGLYQRAGLDAARLLRTTRFAVHPGGPKIIDGVRDVLELSDAQVQTSRDVLADCGNMSSATLPHVWERMVADDDVAPGTLVASLAFGPGLTLAGALLRKQ